MSNRGNEWDRQNMEEARASLEPGEYTSDDLDRLVAEADRRRRPMNYKDMDDLRSMLIENIDDLMRVANAAADWGLGYDAGDSAYGDLSDLRRLRRVLAPFIGPKEEFV